MDRSISKDINLKPLFAEREREGGREREKEREGESMQTSLKRE